MGFTKIYVPEFMTGMLTWKLESLNLTTIQEVLKKVFAWER